VCREAAESKLLDAASNISEAETQKEPSPNMTLSRGFRARPAPTQDFFCDVQSYKGREAY
jgi:hypothetical protein